MCNLYSITTNQAAIAALFRVANGYVGNLAPMPGVFPDYPAPVVCNTDAGRELTMMRWGMPAAAEIAVATGHKYPHHDFTALAALAQAGGPLSRAVQLVCRVCAGAEP
jgi:putative SOS response-associated peptidase YedK